MNSQHRLLHPVIRVEQATRLNWDDVLRYFGLPTYPACPAPIVARLPPLHTSALVATAKLPCAAPLVGELATDWNSRI